MKQTNQGLHQQHRPPNPATDEAVSESPVLNASILLCPDAYHHLEEQSLL